MLFAFLFFLNFSILLASGFSIIFLFFLTRFLCYVVGLPANFVGSILQCSLHSNVGYIGLAIIFYYMGSEGIARVSFTTIFIVTIQNFISIIGFQTERIFDFKSKDFFLILKKIIVNPVIISSILGLICAMTRLSLPKPIDRTFDILSGLALPIALLIIGGSLTYVEKIKERLLIIFYVCLTKLFLLPALAVFFLYYNCVSQEDFISTIILLASPTATISCIFAKEMGGDSNFSAVIVSLTTIFSVITISFWLNFLAF